MTFQNQRQDFIGIAPKKNASKFIAYRMGRLCGGAHEISGIKAPLFLCGGWLEGSWGGWVCGGGVGHGVGGWWWGGGGVGHGVGGCVSG